MADKRNIRKGRTEKKLPLSDMLSPNVRIMSMFIVAFILIVSVFAISIVSASKVAKPTPVKEVGKTDHKSNDPASVDENRMGEYDFGTPDEISDNVEKDEGAEPESEEDVVTKTTIDPATAPLPFTGELSFGEDDNAIAAIQERLMELAYMDYDEATTHFGPITRDAIKRFQRRAGVEVTGKVNEETYRLLMGEDAPEYMICLGDDGDDVSDVQDRLYEMGYISVKPTGYYGDVTESAVKKFQEKNNIISDGKIGAETKELLYSSDAVPNIWEKGDSGEEILTYQKRLVALGYLTTEPDGINGSNTITAVKRFQDRNGLVSDGYLGPKTISVLMSDDVVANAFAFGDRGDDIEKIQQKLYKLGYVKKSSITGYFGSATEYAVRAFQKRNDLSVDGRVGKKTMNVLMSNDAKKPSSSYQYYSEGSSSGSGSGSSSSSSGSGNGSSNSDSSSGSSSSNSPSVSKLIEAAKSRLGCRYVTGGKGPNVFDCSGLVYWCLNQAGVKQSYLTSRDWRSVSKYQKITSINSLRKGDIIVFYGHVGIIVSDSEMIDASSTNGKVVRRSFKGDWSRRNFICGYRIFD